uniref:Uncharacterized protein n=1 Tax=Alexandrium monilatum TaxID=311494 RepID=A0A7S4VSW3_9DINO|mmetsp:Transcript_53209/g.158583  ORF Transcript_53209/g.158583 Transcript_53209/m.158583 type:complete len:212 (-) Transcript_53209:64-699(-)
MVASHHGEYLLACGASPLPVQRHGARTMAPTAFDSAESLQDLIKDMTSHQRALTTSDSKLQASMGELPNAVKEAKKVFPQYARRVNKSLQEVIDRSYTVNSQVETFNKRIDLALVKALQFAHMAKKQNDFPENALPPELFENAGTVAAHLRRAQRLARKLKQDAAGLGRYAKLQAMKFASAPGPLAACTAPATPQRASAAPRRSRGLRDFL